MNIRDEEQLQQYFERQMSSAQEQNFLINVAARDDMRLAFRSQLELLKAVREDKDSSGSPTFVRSKTLTALGLGGALVPSSLKEHEVQQASIVPASFLQNVGSALKRPVVSVTLGLLLGILGTSALAPSNVSTDRSATTPTTVTAPAKIAPSVTAPSAVASEPAQEMQKPSDKAPVKTMKTTLNATKQTPATETMPVITSNKPGTVDVKTKISNPDEDSGKK